VPARSIEHVAVDQLDFLGMTRTLSEPRGLADVQIRARLPTGNRQLGGIAHHQAFLVKPSSDDFILANQIRLGEQNGPLSFFGASPLKDYRPLQSLVYWAVGRWAIENPFPSIHVLNFAAFAFYALVFILWVRLLRLPLIGTSCAVGMLFLHPILAGPLLDLDGFGRFVVSGWVWLGAYCAYRYAGRLGIAIPLTAICLVFGLGFMEYAAALVPLSAVAVWSGRETGRLRAVLMLLVVLLMIFAGYYVLRVSIIGRESGHLSMSPVTWVTNFILLSFAVLFMGDTVSLYVQRGAGEIAFAGASVILMIAVLIGGSRLWHVVVRTQPLNSEIGSTSKVLVFLPIGLFGSFVPMIFMQHVSEIYASAIAFAFALQAGVAMAGWGHARPKLFSCSVGLFTLFLLWAGTSVSAKVDRIRQTGDRASLQIQNLLAWIPVDAHDRRVALIFFESELPPRRTYSVFLAGDDSLIGPGTAARSAIEWFRPGKNIELVHVILQQKSDVRLDEFDMLLYWNPRTRRFESWKA
jgi:hypothetical protein